MPTVLAELRVVEHQPPSHHHRLLQSGASKLTVGPLHGGGGSGRAVRTHFVALDASHCLRGIGGVGGGDSGGSRRARGGGGDSGGGVGDGGGGADSGVGSGDGGGGGRAEASGGGAAGILRLPGGDRERHGARRSVTFSALRRVVPALPPTPPAPPPPSDSFPVGGGRVGVGRAIGAEIRRQARLRSGAVDADLAAICLAGVGLDRQGQQQQHQLQQPVRVEQRRTDVAVVRRSATRPSTAVASAPPLESSYCLLARPLPAPPAPATAAAAASVCAADGTAACPLCEHNQRRLARLDSLINQLTLSGGDGGSRDAAGVGAATQRRRPFTAAAPSAAAAIRRRRRLTGRSRSLRPLMPPPATTTTTTTSSTGGQEASTEVAVAFHACLASEAFIARELTRRGGGPGDDDADEAGGRGGFPELPERLQRFSENFYSHLKRPKTSGCLFSGRRPWPLRDASWRGSAAAAANVDDDGWGEDVVEGPPLTSAAAVAAAAAATVAIDD